MNGNMQQSLIFLTSNNLKLFDLKMTLAIIFFEIFRGITRINDL